MANHLIKKQVIEASFGNKPSYEVGYPKLVEAYHQIIVPEIERYLDSKSLSHRVIRIESLSLNIGEISEDQIMSEFPRRFLAEFFREMDEKFTMLPSEFKENDLLTEEERSDLNVFEKRVKTGKKEWWDQNKEIRLTNDLFQKTKPVFSNSYDAFKRLIYQNSPDVIFSLLPKDKRTENVMQLWEEYRNTSLYKNSIEQYELKALFWSQLIVLESSELNRNAFHLVQEIEDNWTFTDHDSDQKRGNSIIQKGIDMLVRSNSNLEGITSSKIELFDLYRILKRGKSTKEAVELIVKKYTYLSSYSVELNRIVDFFKHRILEVEEEKQLDEELRHFFYKIKTNIKDQNGGIEEFVSISKRTNLPIKKKGKAKKIEEKELQDEIYVANAGIILLWPFFQRIFHQLNLLDEKNHWKTESSSYNAVHILQYFISERKEFDLNELALNQILCGLSTNEIIPEIPVNDRWIEESMKVITAVLGSNKVFENTSIEGFRQAFLERKGILKRREGKWLLQVQKETHDILLQKLPWAYNAVKFPWIEQYILVEW